jgi:hypothetical protein
VIAAPNSRDAAATSENRFAGAQNPTVWHVSERADIGVFVPRVPADECREGRDPLVWAIDSPHLPNYLVPRDCPRVAFHVLPDSSAADRRHFLGSQAHFHHVVAIESAWFSAASNATLWVYGFAPEDFSLIDPVAGYFVSRSTVRPIVQHRIEHPLAEIVALGVELRVLGDLRGLAQAVAASSLAFSCIRMRNACRGPTGLDRP